MGEIPVNEHFLTQLNEDLLSLLKRDPKWRSPVQDDHCKTPGNDKIELEYYKCWDKYRLNSVCRNFWWGGLPWSGSKRKYGIHSDDFLLENGHFGEKHHEFNAHSLRQIPWHISWELPSILGVISAKLRKGSPAYQ